jgi:hypothetical protein
MPGVVVFEDRFGVLRAYSHHSNDPLADGRSHDATGLFCTLNGLTYDEAMPLLVEMVQDYIAEELDRLHPVILQNGSEYRFVNFYHETDDSQIISLVRMQNFSYLQADKPVVWEVSLQNNDNLALSTKTRDQFWLKYPKKTVYNGLVFHPCSLDREPEKAVYRGEKIYYNLFKGWSIQPKPGRWDYLAWHLRNTICNEDDEAYEYLLDWWAHLAQSPREKPGVALVMRGGKGTGKSEVIKRLSKVFGSHASVIGSTDHLTTNFNSHLRNKLLITLEESYWSGSANHEGILKHLITDDKTSYEAKGVDAVQGESFFRVVMITNNDWAAPVSFDERRFFIPDISTASVQANRTTKLHKDGDFFPFLFQEMDNGGVEAFFHAMLQRDLSNRNIRQAPNTKTLSGQHVQSLTKEEAWLYDILDNGYLISPNGSLFAFQHDGLSVPLIDLVGSVNSYLTSHDRKHSVQARVKTLMSRKLPNTSRVLMAGGNVFVRFLSLEACRKDYESSAKIEVEWGTKLSEND